MELDKIDKAILNLLQADAKITNTALAQKIHLSPAATLERVKKLEQQQIITSYHAQLNYTKVGLGVEVIMGIVLQSVTGEHTQQFKTTIAKIEAITICYQIIGDFDFMVMVRTKDIVTYQSVIEKLYALPSVEVVKSLFITQLLKHKPILLG